MIHGGVRWKTSSLPTFGAIAGTIWIALAPVPMTPTRFPSSGYEWSQRAEWKVFPANDASPGISGYDGRLSPPHPETSARARSVCPSLVPTVQSPVRSSNARAGDLGVEADVRPQAVLVRAVIEVREDLGLRAEAPRPARVRLEGERVEVRRDVARRARVVVVAPGAADAVRLLEDREVVDARLLEADPHPQPREAGADDEDLVGDDAHLGSSAEKPG